MTPTRRNHRRYDVDLAANARVTEYASDIGPEMLDLAPVQITNVSLRGMHVRAEIPYPVESEILVNWFADGKERTAVGRIRYRMTEFQDGKTLYGHGVKLDNEETIGPALTETAKETVPILSSERH